MKKLLVKKVDAFTDTPLAGNPAAVVHGADTLSDREMQGLAREMGLRETAFVLSPEEQGADFSLRTFGPDGAREPGHGVLAAYHSLFEEKTLKVSGAQNRFTHHVGEQRVEVEVRRRGAFEQIMLTPERPSFGEKFADPKKLAKVLGVEAKQLHGDLPLQRMNERMVVVPLDALATLEGLQPDFEALRKMQRRDKVNAVVAFTKDTHEMASNYHLRYFAPALGVDEDPVTIEAHAVLAPYLVRQKVVKSTAGVANLNGEQGHAVGRPGKVTVEVRSEGQVIREVRVGGMAVTTLRGEVQLA